MSSSLDDFAQGTGIVVPQGTIASDGSDLNHSYGFGAQAYIDNGSSPTGNPGWEYDFVGQGTFASLVFTTGTGGPPTPADISDPFAYFVTGTPDEYTAVPIAGTAAAPDAAGRYAFPSATPFAVGPVGGADGPTDEFTVVMYEAGPGLVFSIDEDDHQRMAGHLPGAECRPAEGNAREERTASQEPIETETLTSRQFGGWSANRAPCFWSQNDFTLIPRSLESSNAGRPTQRESGLEGTESGDQRARGESWKSNRAPGVSTCGSFPRLRESLQPSVLPVGCRCATSSFDQEQPDAWNSPPGYCSIQVRDIPRIA